LKVCTGIGVATLAAIFATLACRDRQVNGELIGGSKGKLQQGDFLLRTIALTAF
jgi:hypothetical protein